MWNCKRLRLLAILETVLINPAFKAKGIQTATTTISSQNSPPSITLASQSSKTNGSERLAIPQAFLREVNNIRYIYLLNYGNGRESPLANIDFRQQN